MPKSFCPEILDGPMGIASSKCSFDEVLANTTDEGLEELARRISAMRRGGEAEPNEEELQEEVKNLEGERRRIRNSRAV